MGARKQAWPNPPSSIRRLLRLLITLVTVVLLGLAVRDVARFPIDFNELVSSEYKIQVESNKKANLESSDRKLWVKALIVDGRCLRWESIEPTNNWKAVDVLQVGKLLPVLDDDTQPAILRFQGKNLLAMVQADHWSGTVQLLKNGSEVQKSEASKEQQLTMILEDPVAPLSTAVLAAALILFAGCAAWFGPLRADRDCTAWLIFFLSVFHILFWSSQCVGTTNDSPGYVADFKIILAGMPAYFPPGYPALLGLVGAMSGENLGGWITLFQHAMLVVSGFWIYLLLRRITFEELALLGGILAGVMPSCLTVSQSVMSETPTLFAMVGAFYFAVRSTETSRLWFSILAGLLTGWAGTLRVVPLAALIPSLLMVYLLPHSMVGFRRFGITLVSLIVIITVPLLWFGFNTGLFTLTSSTGLHLFNRVVTEQQLLDRNGAATRTLLSILEGKDPRGVPHWEVAAGTLGYREKELLLRRVSLEGIQKDPWKFIGYTFPLAWRMYQADSFYWIPSWGDTGSLHSRLETPPVLGFTASSFAWRQSLVRTQRGWWPVICWAGIAGVLPALFHPQRILILSMAWIPVGYLLSSACVEYFNGRFNVAVVPFVVVCSMVTLSAIFAVPTLCKRFLG